KAEAEAKEKAEAEAKAKAEQEAAAAVAVAAAATSPAPAAPATSATDSLLADLDSFSMRDDEERERQEAEEKARKAAEEKARLEAEARAKREAEEKKQREEEEQRRKEDEARLAREEEERQAREAEERGKAEEAERKRKAKDSMARHQAGSGTPPKQKKSADDESEEDIDISDDDLDLDDVKADEKKLAKVRKKDQDKDQHARDRIDSTALKASKAADSVIPAMHEPVKVRRPVKWGKPVAIGLFVLLLGGLGVLQVMPLSNSSYERLASEALGRPVKIGAVHLSIITGVELRLDGLSVGEGVRATTVHAVPQLGTLFSDKKAFSRISIEGLVIPQEELGAALLGGIKGDGLTIGRITAAKAKLAGPAALPDLDLEIELGPNGAVQSVGLKSAESKLVGRILPQSGGASVEINAGSLAVPFVPGMTLSDFGLKGTATAQELSVSAWDGKIFDGVASGTARIRWGARWSVEGEMRVRQMNVGVLAPALMSDGKADAQGSYSMSGAAPDKLGAEARMEGRFSVSKGVLGSFDLARALQPTASQATGRTLFSELTGAGVYSRGAVQLREMKLTAGLLTASGSMDIDAAGHVSGRVTAELGQQRGSIALSGTAKEPKISR
ncbi:MAG: hypothetical protein JSS40_14075, partial [Proteobacteria bacterium]|nr:hypothetical protein [Pseudomonadota bacterium]